MNEELIKKLEQQEEEERRIRHDEAEQKRLASIPAAPVPPLRFSPKRYVSQQKDDSTSSSTGVKKVDMSKAKGAIQTLSPTQLQEALNTKLRHVSAEDLIRPIPKTEFAFIFDAITARRLQIEGNNSLSGENDNNDFD